MSVHASLVLKDSPGVYASWHNCSPLTICHPSRSRRREEHVSEMLTQTRRWYHRLWLSPLVPRNLQPSCKTSTLRSCILLCSFIIMRSHGSYRQQGSARGGIAREDGLVQVGTAVQVLEVVHQYQPQAIWRGRIEISAKPGRKTKEFVGGQMLIGSICGRCSSLRRRVEDPAGWISIVGTEDRTAQRS